MRWARWNFFFRHGGAPGIWNACDNEPVRQVELYRWLCAPSGLPMPPSGPAAAKKRGSTDKRVSNAKLRSAGWKPRYPSFREGYAEMVSADSSRR